MDSEKSNTECKFLTSNHRLLLEVKSRASLFVHLFVHLFGTRSLALPLCN